MRDRVDLIDATDSSTFLSADFYVTLLSPSCSPGVLDNPMISLEANSQNAMGKSGSA